MCMISDADGLCVVLHDKDQIARKEHKCDECSRQIPIGETYKNECLVWEGAKSTHKTCAHCMIVRNWLLGECGGWVYGEIYTDIEEHSWEGYGAEIKLMAVGMRRKWTRKDGKPWRLPRQPKSSGHAQAA